MTALQKFIEQITPFIDRTKISDTMLHNLVEEHLEMENNNAVLFAKEYDEYLFRGCGLPRLTAEQYYNQTYNK